MSQVFLRPFVSDKEEMAKREGMVAHQLILLFVLRAPRLFILYQIA